MNDRDFNFPLLLPNLAVLLLVAVGLLSDNAPLVSHRPVGVELVTTESNEVPARLWEDPFGVKPPANNQASPPFLQEGLRSALADKSAAFEQDRSGARNIRQQFRLLVLPVLLSSENYPEAIEQRLRTRYAVVSALGRTQYVSTKQGRLQFAVFPQLSRPGSPEFTVPFEEYDVRRLVADDVEMVGNENYWRPEDRPQWDSLKPKRLRIENPYDRIVVLWLDEERMLGAGRANSTAGLMAFRLDEILKDFFGAAPARFFAVPGSPSGSDRSVTMVELAVKILGPTSSDKLVSLLESNGKPPVKLEDAPPLFELLSPRATAPDAALQISSTHEVGFEKFVLSQLQGMSPPWPVRRTITTDDRLTSAVLDELTRRRASPGGPNHLVLIGEWDTLYSRALSRTFAAQLNARDLKNAPEVLKLQATWANNPAYLHEFSYLRGLDGRLADPRKPAGKTRAQEEETKDQTKSDEPAGDSGSPPKESAEGRSQLDYLRRLEGSVRALQAELEGKQQTISAIGVIGSDAYDKLLVLRALRGSFPGTVFFTTDFDAGYVDRDESKWTSNLVVVSPFGLTASQALQGRIPPFRDSYQTALFLTVLNAVGVTKVAGKDLRLDATSIPPRVFELGRTGYVELSSDKTDDATAAVHPTRDVERPNLWWLGLTVVAIGFAGLWWKTTPSAFFECTLALLWIAALIAWSALAVKYVPQTMTKVGAIGTLVLGLGLLVPFHLLQRRYKSFNGLLNRPYSKWQDGAILALTGAVLIGSAVILYLGIQKAMAPSEEPFAWFQGLSIWPAEIVRLVAAIFAILCIVLAQYRLGNLKRQLTRQFFGQHLIAHRQSPAPTPPPATILGSAGTNGHSDHAFHHFQHLKDNWLADGDEDNLEAEPARARPPVSGNSEYTLWVRFLELTSPKQRFIRVVLCVFGYLLVFRLLSALGVFTSAANPVRGEWSYILDRAITYAEVIIDCTLLFFVLDVTVLTANLIAKLTPYIAPTTELDQADAIHLINEMTKAVAGLVYLPFSVLFMMIVSRNPLFDAYTWPPVSIAYFGTGLLLIFLAAVTLQQRARAAKQAALDVLDRKLVEHLVTKARQPVKRIKVTQPLEVASTSPVLEPAIEPVETSTQLVLERDSETSEELLRENRDQINGFNSVAFREWHHNPIFRAILIPLGGVGSLHLLERFSGMF